MILATTTVEDVDRFLDVSGTKGADKRALHGSKGSTVFRDPTEENRVWALFDWDEAGWAKFVSDPEVPPILKEAGHLGKPQAALLLGSYQRVRVQDDMTTAINRPARVGLITDQTGALSFMGIANVNIAKMVTDDINDRGGLLGRPVELFVEDSATDDKVAEAAAAKLVERAVDVVVGGIYSSTRQAIKRPVVDQAETLYIYPEQYEGQECHPLIFCTGPVPAQQVEPFFPWLMQQTGAKRFYMPSADYIWPHTMNKKVREVVTAEGGEIVGEEYFPLDHTDYERIVDDIMSTGAEVVFNTIVPPGLTPFLEQLHRAGFTRRGGHIVCTYFDENFLNLVPAVYVEGLYGCLDYYRDVDDPFSIELLNRYEGLYPGSAMFTAGSACTGTYRALKLWESAVNEAGSLNQDDVVNALDHARIAQGPGGPAEMVPGQHHVRMNMYIARSEGGTFKVVKNLGHIDPKECDVGRP